MRIKSLAVLLIVLSYCGVASASANSLISTLPISGSTLTTPPSSVTLTTKTELIPDANELMVTDPSGLRVDDGTIALDGVNVSIGLKALTESGMYRVSYILYSEGEAPLQGSFTFNFSAPSVISPTDPTPTPTQQQTPASSSWGTNVFIFAILVVAFFVLIGLSLYARKLFKDR
ncbi:MAG: copper resistance protein CopC [Candidatus Planktophila sp.]|nr:copper resistance protein CopC [Candidatus Planktophila sp.]